MRDEEAMEPRLVTIRRYQDKDYAQLVPFILDVQRDELGSPISAEDQPELQDIKRSYQRGAGDFWVAVEGTKLVGTVALFDLGGGQAALRKMFVARDFRGAPHRVGQRLLDALLEHAQSHRVKEIYLGTVP